MSKEDYYRAKANLSRSGRIDEEMTVEYRGSTIVGAMARETPFVTFVNSVGQTYFWTSDSINDWENGTWPKWDPRRANRVNLHKGQKMRVSAFVRPDGKTLFRVILTKEIER